MRTIEQPRRHLARRTERARAFVVALIALASCFAIVAPASTRAQTTVSADATTEARRLFLAGEQAYRIGDYETALSSWRQGYALDPRPRFLYNLAQAYERLGSLPEAADSLESYLHAITLDDPLYGEASAHLATLRQRLANTGVRIVGGPAGSEIFIDGQAWGVTPRPDRIPITPGNHAISIHFADGTRHDVALVVTAGQVVDVQVPETANARPTPVFGTPVETTPTPAAQPSEGRHGHALLIAGAAAAGVGAGVLIYGIARQTALSGCSDPGYVCLNDGPVRTQRTLGMVAGSVLLAGGGSLIAIDLLRNRGSSTEARLGVGLASLELTLRH